MAGTSTSKDVDVVADNDATSNINNKSLPELVDIIYLDTTPAVDDNVCKIISNRIRDKETTLVGVIELLGSRLTSTHVMERSKAVEILAHIFAHLPVDFLTETELSFIVDFLCDRCKDQHIVIPKIIMCVQPIVRCKNLPSGAGSKLLEQLFREANVQSHVHKIRHMFFKSLQSMLGKHLTELQEMSSDFVMNFLQSMDGEKDPRNLLLLFRIIPSIIGNFKLDPFIEDFFEILSCYFPIDFNPTVSVPGEEKITRKELAHALHICLSQTNEFSEFLLPLIIEKLESSSVDAKIDSLDLLQLCCERSYTPQDLEPHLSNIWHSMRREIFMGGNYEVENKCYEFLKSAFKMVSRDAAILNTCLTMIYTECKHHLSEPELRLIMPTANILCCISESGETACTSVTEALFPVLYEQVCVKSTKSEKKRLLGIWETLISTCRQYKTINLHSLVSKWDEMSGLWFTLLTNDDWELVTVALKIFTHVIVNDVDFALVHRKMLQEHLLRLIRSSFTMPQDARSALISLCYNLCHFYGEEFSTGTIPSLLNTLSHSASTSEDSGSLCDNECGDKMPCQVRTFSCKVLGDCSHLNPCVFAKVVSNLLEKLALNPLDLVCMKCLGCILEKACSKQEEDNSAKPDLSAHFTNLLIHDKVISITFEICKLLKSESTTIYDAASDQVDITTCWESIRQATCIIRNIFRACNEAEQTICVQKYWNDKVKGNEELEQHLESIPGVLVEAILGSNRRTVEIKLKRDLINYILEKALTKESVIKAEIVQEFYTLPFVRLLASFVNKVIKEEELGEYLKATETFFEKTLNEEKESQQQQPISVDGPELELKINDNVTVEGQRKEAHVNIINALIWTVKALGMRSYQDLDVWVEKIIALLRNRTLGDEVVKCFPYLVADDPYSLNEESFCVQKLFYKQRLFLMVVDKLVSGYRTASSQEIQFNFIRALSSQLKHVPSEILFMKIDSVLPLLVASLKCNSSSQVLLSTLTALMEMMQSPDTKHKLTEYCHDLVPQLTSLAQYKDSMEVRRVSLSCLRNCGRSPTHLILPLRNMVIDNLLHCLDDSKRLVRKEAALTRNIWTLIGAPGGI